MEDRAVPGPIYRQEEESASQPAAPNGALVPISARQPATIPATIIVGFPQQHTRKLELFTRERLR